MNGCSAKELMLRSSSMGMSKQFPSRRLALLVVGLCSLVIHGSVIDASGALVAVECVG
jgi:hypothetical protein